MSNLSETELPKTSSSTEVLNIQIFKADGISLTESRDGKGKESKSDVEPFTTLFGTVR